MSLVFFSQLDSSIEFEFELELGRKSKLKPNWFILHWIPFHLVSSLLPVASEPAKVQLRRRLRNESLAPLPLTSSSGDQFGPSLLN